MTVKQFLFWAVQLTVMALVIAYVDPSTWWYKFIYWWLVAVSWLSFVTALIVFLLSDSNSRVEKKNDFPVIPGYTRKITFLVSTAVWLWLLPQVGMLLAAFFLISLKMEAKNDT